MREPCYKCRFEHKPIDTEPCEYCSDEYMKSGDHPAFEWAKKQTHYDLLIRKTPEELALFIHNVEAQAVDIGSADTVEGWLEWLKQEANDHET